MKKPASPIREITANHNSTNGNLETASVSSYLGVSNDNETTESEKNSGITAPPAISFASKGNTENLVTNVGFKRTASMAVDSKTAKEVMVTGSIRWSPIESVTLKKT